MHQIKNIAVVGGGIIGLALGYKLSLQQAKVTLFEKEAKEGLHQSGRNSGVLHSGLYYQPGSLKAQLSVQGIQEMIEFARENEIPHEICGKVVVANSDREELALEALAQRGGKNGLLGLKYLDQQGLEKREPHVRAQKALLVPQEGIIDYKAVMRVMINKIKENNGEVYFRSPVSNIKQETINEVQIATPYGVKSFDQVVVCAGLWSDIAFRQLTRQKPPLRIVPFRGEYLKFKSGYEEMVNHLVYPVPDVQFPFLGVHFTRMIDGSREVGPNAVLSLKRDGYRTNSFSLRDAYDSLTYTGLLRFVSQNFLFSVNEFKSSLFLKDFIAKAQKMIPDVDASMFEKGPAGVRAQAISPKGELQMDFNIFRRGRQVHVLNAPSPGATASLAIASHIIKNYLYKL